MFPKHFRKLPARARWQSTAEDQDVESAFLSPFDREVLRFRAHYFKAVMPQQECTGLI